MDKDKKEQLEQYKTELKESIKHDGYVNVGKLFEIIVFILDHILEGENDKSDFNNKVK